MGKHRAKKRRGRAAGGAQRRGGGSGNSIVAELVRYEIFDGYMPDPKIERLSAPARERYERINDAIPFDAKAQIAELEELIDVHPHIEKLYNYLCLAYQAAGRHDDVNRLIVTTFERFPNYLFGIVNYVSLCIREHRLGDARAAFQNKLTLHELCGRRRFHLSEFLGFHGMMAQYFHAAGDKQQARRYYDCMREIAPDHPTTRHTAWLFRVPRFMRRRAARLPK